MLERDKDYMDVCNPDTRKYKPEVFEKDICRQCARPECIRSSYRQSATEERLAHAKELTTFLDPTKQVEESPLSYYPDELGEDGKFIHRAEVSSEVHEPDNVDEAARALAQLVHPTLPKVDDAPEKNATTPATPLSTGPTPEPPRPADPWAAPEGVRMNIYKEFEDSKDDPWSVDYEGPRRIKAESGVTITLSGRRKK